MAIVIDLFNTFLFPTKSIVSGAYIFIFEIDETLQNWRFSARADMHITIYNIFHIFYRKSM